MTKLYILGKDGKPFRKTIVTYENGREIKRLRWAVDENGNLTTKEPIAEGVFKGYTEEGLSIIDIYEGGFCIPTKFDVFGDIRERAMGDISVVFEFDGLGRQRCETTYYMHTDPKTKQEKRSSGCQSARGS